MAEKVQAKDDQWDQGTVPAIQAAPEVSDWAAEAPMPSQTMAGQFSVGAPAPVDDWTAPADDWSKQVPAAAGSAPPPTANWGGDTVESWN